MSKFSRQREMEKVPPWGQRVISVIDRRFVWILGWLFLAGVGDFLKDWVRGKAMDWLLDHFGVIAIFVLNYKFAILTLAVILVLIWIGWEAIRLSTASVESIIDKPEGGKFEFTQVSWPRALGFCLAILILITFVGYGAFNYYRNSPLINGFHSAT